MIVHFTTRLPLLIVGFLLVQGCSDDDGPDPPFDPPELITTVTLTLTEGGTSTVFSFVDLDGPGGDDPVVTGGTLNASRTYEYQIQFLNESVSPIDDVTEEVVEEGRAHQVFLDFGTLRATLDYEDLDADGRPIGVVGSFTVGDGRGATDLTLTLRHDLDKGAMGVVEGDITNAGGDTDVEVVFPITIQ